MIDKVDIRILKALKYNSKIPIKHLADKIHLSPPAAAERIARLKERGIIKNYTIEVNPEKLGYTRPFFIRVNTVYPQEKRYLKFITQKQKFILHHYRTTGIYNYIIEGAFKNIAEFNSFLDQLSDFGHYEVIDILHEMI